MANATWSGLQLLLLMLSCFVVRGFALEDGEDERTSLQAGSAMFSMIGGTFASGERLNAGSVNETRGLLLPATTAILKCMQGL